MKALFASFKILRLQELSYFNHMLSDKSLSPVEVWKQSLLRNSYSDPTITAWFVMARDCFEPQHVIPAMTASCQ